MLKGFKDFNMIFWEMYLGFIWVNIICFLFFDVIILKMMLKKIRIWSVLMCVIFGYYVIVCIVFIYFYRNLGFLVLMWFLYVIFYFVYFRSCCLKFLLFIYEILFFSIWMKIINWVGECWRLCFDFVLWNKDYIYFLCKKSYYWKFLSVFLGLSRKWYLVLIVVFINRFWLKLVIFFKLNYNK